MNTQNLVKKFLIIALIKKIIFLQVTLMEIIRINKHHFN